MDGPNTATPYRATAQELAAWRALGRRPPAAAATAAALGAAQRISIRISIAVGEASDDSSCVVCLQPCTSKACACSFMHQCCAVKYAATFGDACKVCEEKFEPARLCKRRFDAAEVELELVAKKRARERATAERAVNSQWARLVAPCAAQILLAHYLYSEEAGRGAVGPTSPLCFDSVILRYARGPSLRVVARAQLMQPLYFTISNPHTSRL